MSAFSYKGRGAAGEGFGKYGKWDKNDVVDRLLPIFQRGHYHITPSGIIKSNAPNGVSMQTPWLHQTHCPGLKCNLWHFLMFNHYGWFIPSGCQDCWKVVVAPRTLSELFKLKDLQWELGMPSKCGIEVRDYTGKLYGGYFYNRGLHNGRKCYDIVREAVDDAISPDVPTLLKRACTEFEMKFPKSSTWQVTPEQMEIETLLDDRVEETCNPAGQPDIIRTHIKRTWVHWAYTNADQTYKEFTNGKDLYPDQYETYHDRTLEECEQALNNSLATHLQMDPEKLTALNKDLIAVAGEHNTDADHVAMALGFRDMFKCGFTGEHDELSDPKMIPVETT